MATSVATPLERQLGLIAGITQNDVQDLGQYAIRFNLIYPLNIDGAARDVQAAH